ncbi:MAG: AraC family transcriptional regulator [Chitinophagaceae bacterium]
MRIESSFNIRHDVILNYGMYLHYHQEYELHFLIKGEGLRFIGENISHFASGEIIMLGENLPHGWHSKDEYLHQHCDNEMEAIVIHFSNDFLGNDFLRLPEASLIHLLFEKAKRGMIFFGATKKKLGLLMIKAAESEGLDKIITLISILKIILETSDYRAIAKFHSFVMPSDCETERLNKICSYTMANFRKNITLKEVASISNLTITSFCRYFKLMTKKSYNNFLKEVRIGHSCQFLIEDKLSISQIADKCGFYNISNFYRRFKNVMGVTPQVYKLTHLRP